MHKFHKLISFIFVVCHILYHRARAYTCKRQWDKARQDYAFVLKYIPGDPEATQGLAEMTQIVEPYPMNIPDR